MPPAAARFAGVVMTTSNIRRECLSAVAVEWKRRLADSIRYEAGQDAREAGNGLTDSAGADDVDSRALIDWFKSHDAAGMRSTGAAPAKGTRSAIRKHR